MNQNSHAHKFTVLGTCKGIHLTRPFHDKISQIVPKKIVSTFKLEGVKTNDTVANLNRAPWTMLLKEAFDQHHEHKTFLNRYTSEIAQRGQLFPV